MRMGILMILLSVASSNAVAGWVKVGGGGGEVAIYTDPSTISKSGHIAKMWELHDLKNASTFNGTPYISLRMQVEYDCQEAQVRMLFTSLHSEHMAESAAVYSFNSSGISKWEPVPPETTVRDLWKLACGKK